MRCPGSRVQGGRVKQGRGNQYQRQDGVASFLCHRTFCKMHTTSLRIACGGSRTPFIHPPLIRAYHGVFMPLSSLGILGKGWGRMSQEGERGGPKPDPGWWYLHKTEQTLWGAGDLGARCRGVRYEVKGMGRWCQEAISTSGWKG